MLVPLTPNPKPKLCPHTPAGLAEVRPPLFVEPDTPYPPPMFSPHIPLSVAVELWPCTPFLPLPNTPSPLPLLDTANAVLLELVVPENGSARPPPVVAAVV